MSSVIKVDEIQTAVGGTKVFDMIREFDTWRISANFTTAGGDITGWERPDSVDANVFPGPIGTGLTEESGIFSFPMTGYYRIDAIICFKSTRRDSNHEVVVKVSNDNGSNYTDYVQATIGNAETDQYLESCSMKFFINVKNVSGSNTTMFHFETLSNNPADEEVILGDTDINLTYFTCQRLAPAQ